MKEAGYKQLPHMSDAIIEAWSPTLAGAFEASAAGLISVITDVRRVRCSSTLVVPPIKDKDVEGLLYQWLEFILVKFDTEKLLLPRASLKIESAHNSYLLHGKVRGEHFDPARHRIKREVKAVTYHQMEVESVNNTVRIRFLLDL